MDSGNAVLKVLCIVPALRSGRFEPDGLFISQALRSRLAQGRAAEIFIWVDDQVIKLLRKGFSKSALEAEAMITRIVYDAGLPVPTTEGIVEVGGRPGIIFERIDGASMMDELNANPETVVQAAHLLAELHAAIHKVHVPNLLTIKERLERNIHAVEGLKEGIREAALNALDGLPNNDAVCHGDFHPGNILMSSRGPIIVDWNDTTRGDPLSDIARTLLLFRFATDQPEVRIEFDLEQFHRSYLERYLQLRDVFHQQVEAWELPVAFARLSEGIAGERDSLVAFIEHRAPWQPSSRRATLPKRRARVVTAI